MRKITLLVSAFMLTVATAVAQTWDIGTPNAGDLTATLSDGTLTISGTGEMQNFAYYEKAPWYNVRYGIDKLVIEEGVTSIGNYAFYECNYITGSLNIPQGVTTIGGVAFGRCSSLTGSLTIPESVTTVGYEAFNGCGFTGLLTIPEGVTTIGYTAFGECSNLVTINVNSSNKNYSSDDGILYDKSKTTLIQCPAGKTGSLIIPESVTAIEGHAFYGCKKLTGLLTLPEGITIIGHSAFSGCSGFSGSLTIPKGVTGISTQAFDGCSGFTGPLTIPNGVTGIGHCAFRNCSGLSGLLTIPASVRSIGDDAFSNCKGLNSVSNFAIEPQNIRNDRYVFKGLTLNNIPLYVPYKSVALYQEAEVWKEFDIIGRYYEIKATIDNNEYGTVNNWYVSDNTATFTATPAAGYEFVNWTKNGVAESSENPYTFTVTGDVELVANFRKIETSINSISSEAAVIVGYYSFSGVKLLQEPERGMYIVVYGDGRREKVFKR